MNELTADIEAAMGELHLTADRLVNELEDKVRLNDDEYDALHFAIKVRALMEAPID